MTLNFQSSSLNKDPSLKNWFALMSQQQDMLFVSVRSLRNFLLRWFFITLYAVLFLTLFSHVRISQNHAELKKKKKLKVHFKNKGMFYKGKSHSKKNHRLGKIFFASTAFLHILSIFPLCRFCHIFSALQYIFFLCADFALFCHIFVHR